MGDIIHTLPAVAWLKQSHPGAHLTWLVEPRWAPLLDENPYVDRVVLLRRQSLSGLMETRRELRTATYDFAVDFQGLLKSAMAASAAHPGAALRLSPIATPRARCRTVLFRQDLEPFGACGGPEPGTGGGVRRPAAMGRPSDCSRYRRDGPRASCRRAISYSLRRWPDGGPSNGRWATFVLWPDGCAMSSDFRSCSTDRRARISQR